MRAWSRSNPADGRSSEDEDEEDEDEDRQGTVGRGDIATKNLAGRASTAAKVKADPEARGKKVFSATSLTCLATDRLAAPVAVVQDKRGRAGVSINRRDFIQATSCLAAAFGLRRNRRGCGGSRREVSVRHLASGAVLYGLLDIAPEQRYERDRRGPLGINDRSEVPLYPHVGHRTERSRRGYRSEACRWLPAGCRGCYTYDSRREIPASPQSLLVSGRLC